jgi:multiple sugar transport system substrate-binding protein
MGKKTVILITVLIFISIAIDYSAITIKRSNSIKPATIENDDANNTKESVELRLWTYYEGFEWPASTFTERNPSIKVKVEVFSKENFVQRYLNAVAKGEAPDLIVLDSEHIQDVNGNESLQNLLEEPFNAGQYRMDFQDSLWRLASSFDKKSLIGMPIATTPMLAYYREDIMKLYGFPAEPRKLEEYMKDPNNWLKIAQTLKKDNRYIAQWSSEPIRIYEAGTGLLDDNLKFLRNNSDFRKAIDMSREVKKGGLALNTDVWSQQGQQAVRDGKLVMLYLGNWGTGLIKNWAPEQSGKWRIMALPFGVNGWINSTIISVSSASGHKEEAWKFIKYYTLEVEKYYGDGTIPVYLPARGKLENESINEDFLGGQDILTENKRVTEALKEPVITPLYDKVRTIWYDKIEKSIASEIDPGEVLSELEEEVWEKIGTDKEALLKSLDK